jgi:hypothetical protein
MTTQKTTATQKTTDSATCAGLKELTALFASVRRLEAISAEVNAQADEIGETIVALATRFGIEHDEVVDAYLRDGGPKKPRGLRTDRRQGRGEGRQARRPS